MRNYIIINLHYELTTFSNKRRQLDNGLPYLTWKNICFYFRTSHFNYLCQALKIEVFMHSMIGTNLSFIREASNANHQIILYKDVKLRWNLYATCRHIILLFILTIIGFEHWHYGFYPLTFHKAVIDFSYFNETKIQNANVILIITQYIYFHKNCWQ